MKKYLVEFVGTFFLVFVIGLAVRSGTPFAPFAIGAILMVMIYAGGHVSGAHFNPAITLVAAVLVNYLFGGRVLNGPALHGTIPSVIVEFLFTFALGWVILNTATHKGTAGNSFYGIAIGMTVMAGAVTVGGISGGAFNPAVGLAVFTMGLESAKQLGIYVVADFAGAIAAALFFKAVHGSD